MTVRAVDVFPGFDDCIVLGGSLWIRFISAYKLMV